MADPGVVAETRETDTTPVSVGVITVSVCAPFEKVPRLVVKVTEVPLGTAAPLLYVTVAVMAEELVPSAGMVMGFATRVMEPTSLASKETVVVIVMDP